MINLKLMPPPSTVMTPRESPRRRSLAARLRFGVASLFALLVLLELGLRCHDWLRLGLPFAWDPTLMLQERTAFCNPFLPNRGTDTDWSRRAKTPEQVIEANGRRVLRIVCLGGEATLDATAFATAKTTWAAELQQALNEKLGSSRDVVVEVINAGFTDHTSLHALILLQTELLQLRPDLVIYSECLNDVVMNYFPDLPGPAYAHALRRPHFLTPELRPQRQATLLDHSRLYTWIREALSPVVWYRVRHREGPGKTELADAGEFRINLQNVVAICQAHHIRVLFTPQPYASDRWLFDKHFKAKSYTQEIIYPPPAQVHEHVQEYQRIMREIATRAGVAWADGCAPLHERHELFEDCVRLRPEGSRLWGRDLARFLMDSPLWDELLAGKGKQDVS